MAVVYPTPSNGPALNTIMSWLLTLAEPGASEVEGTGLAARQEGGLG